MNLSLSYMLFLLVIVVSSNGDVAEEALDFLSTFGYYKKNNKDVGSMANKNEIENSIKKYQQFSGLPVTGVLDETTQKQMKKVRCGMTDIVDGLVKRKRRYNLQGTSWRKNELAWQLSNDNNDGLSRKQVESILKQALSKWEDVSSLRFYKTDSLTLTDIEFKFMQGDHGDSYPFQPHQRIYAHAFYPFDNTGVNGDVHFNDAYNFNKNEKGSVSLLYIALHELGHSLGLEHSKNLKAVMYPTYADNINENSIALHEDDILGIQHIYGLPSKASETTGLPSQASQTTGSTSRAPNTSDCRNITLEGRCCVFPFVYQSVKYNECVYTEVMGRYWCSLTYEYIGLWQTCLGSLSQASKTTISPSEGPETADLPSLATETTGSTSRAPETTFSPSQVPETKKVSITIVIIIAAVLVPILVFFILGTLWICKKKLKSKTSIWNTDLYIYDNYKGYDKLSPDEWEIYPDKISLESKLGEGVFGNVFFAKMSRKVLAKTNYLNKSTTHSMTKDLNIKVAVKLVKDRATQSEFDDFVEEINLMKEIGYHKNVLSMIGCCTQKKPFCLVVEYMENGDLLQFLRKMRSISTRMQKIPLDEVEVVTSDDLLNFAWQVASGMEYISSIKLVHRDLAARNILVDCNKNLKISDFGLTRKVNDELKYFGKNTRRLPVRWMSVEAIFDHTFTSYSDVWAYGVVLFEIVTLGGTPYPAINNCELLARLKTGYRMDRPDNCSLPIYDIMMHCWNKNPLLRPTFAELRKQFEEIMSRDVSYFNLEIDEENIYYKVASFHSISSDENDDEQENEEEENPKSFQLKPINKTKNVTSTNNVLLKMV